MTEETTLEHYGIIRRSGRYPWGSGENPYQRSKDFYSALQEMRDKGLSDSEISQAWGLGVPEGSDKKATVSALRDTISIASNQMRAAERSRAMILREKGMSVSAIGRAMGKTESSVRSLLDPSIAKNQAVLTDTMDALRSEIADKKYIDIGAGTEHYMGITRDKLLTAAAVLEDEGYSRWYVSVPQQTGRGETTIMVLTNQPNSEFPKLKEDPSQIKVPMFYAPEKGDSLVKIQKPRSFDSSRLEVAYGEDGGAEQDGLIEIRRGAEDLDMGNSRYAQVRILVDDTHYIKGMAVVSDDLPKGVDIRFNTPKESTGNKLDALKPIEPDPNNPFGSSIRRQKTYLDKNGKEQLTVLNIVGEEGDWHEWNARLSSQMLSKQNVPLMREQLKSFRDVRQADLDEIKALTNPTLKQELLREFSETADSDAVELNAMGLPGTKQHVLIPIPDMKTNEVYAPAYKQGDTVVLIRHPHAGIFEIPVLTVNNRVPAAQKVLGKQPVDAIGINATVAEQLSGADFDGDTVLVIPDNTGKIKTSRPIASLQNFDPKVQYEGYEGMKVMKNTQMEMGMISNLITDMSIRGAPVEDIVKATKHSMVVIDAEKHKLDYKQSEKDHGILALKKEYQPDGGASTVISRAKSPVYIKEQKARPAKDGGPIDLKTGELKFVPKEGDYVKTVKTTKMGGVSDARKLMSTKTGTEIERVYADHANSLKQMANQARLEMVNTAPLKRNPSAVKTYQPEVKSLGLKLKEAQMNAPRERQAQVVAGVKMGLRLQANPHMTEGQIKKARNQEVYEARELMGAHKQVVDITPREWEAIQAGAIAHTPLQTILRNADPQKIREYATPRSMQGIQGPRLSRALSMLNSGYTQAEIADVLGVSVSTIQSLIKNS